MHKMTTEAIKKLLSETNHVLTVEDFELIEELDACAAEFAGVSSSERRLLNQPFSLCGINFYPLTVAKSLWYTEKVEEWEVTGSQQEALLFWLLSLPNTEEALDTYAEQKAADKACGQLSRRLHCTNEELTDIYHKCLGVSQASGGDNDSKNTDYGGMIAVLLREYGGKPNEWLYETPVQMISTLFTAYANRVNAENNAASGGRGKGAKAKAPAPSAKLAAMSKFRAVVNKIRKLWESDNGE